MEGSYKEKLKNLGVFKHIEVNFSGVNISLLSILSNIAKIYRYCKLYNPDIVHCYTHKGCIAGGSALFFSRSQARLFFTITGLGRIFTSKSLKNIFLQKMITTIYFFLCKRTHKVFFQNPDDAELFMRKSRLVKEKIILVGGSGVNLKKINTYTDYKLDLNGIPSKKINSSQNEKIVILMLGRGMFEKGFFEFYEAAKLFNQLFPEKYLFIHAGYIDEDVLKNIENSDIYEFAKKYSVHYLGFRQDSEALLSYADIVVHPSSYREGVPRSLIEALAMDKSIITCNTIGNRETVIDGWNGLFCIPGSANSLVSCILKIDRKFLFNAQGKSMKLAEIKFNVCIIDDKVFESYFR